jgi:inorganic triphosphatase YgiF
MATTYLQEIETKLRVESAPELDRIPRWVAEQGGLCSPIEIRNVRDVYLDTPDRWFYRVGVACRMRTFTRNGRRELTLKSLLRPEAGLATRTEFTETLKGAGTARYPGRFPGRAIMRRLLPWLEGRKVSPVFSLDQHRRVFTAVFNKTGLQVEISLDETRLMGTSNRMQVAEFELQKGSASDLRALTRACHHALETRKETPSKFAWASRHSGIHWPGPPADTPQLVASDRFVDGVYRILETQWALMDWNLPGTGVGLHPEKPHDLRVAVRRLTVALRIFKDILPPIKTTRLIKDLKWINAILSPVRDLEVYQAQLQQDLEEVRPDYRQALEFYARMVRLEHHHEFRRLIRILRSDRWTETWTRIKRFVESREIIPDQLELANAHLHDILPDLIRQSIRKTLKKGRALAQSRSPEELHQLRRRCRKLRYLCEFLRQVYGRSLRKIWHRANACQSALGQHQDAVVEIALIRAFRESTSPRLSGRPIIGRALDRLEAQRLKRVVESQSFFKKAWKRFDSGDLFKKTLKRMRQTRTL